MSLVLPFPTQSSMPHSSPPLLPRTSPRSSPTPRLSRPSTPPSIKDLQHHGLSTTQPISAPTTPVTPTHFFHLEPGPSRMERCRSSEAAIGSQPIPALPAQVEEVRDGRRREVKTTSLLFKSISKEQIHGMEKGEVYHLEAPISIPSPDLTKDAGVDGSDDKMDIDVEDQPELLSEEAVAEKMATMQDEAPQVWGMPKWGWEEERKEVRKGVRLVGMEELPGLIEQHNMLDVPSQRLFPWLHGISDDGVKGRDMAAFFGRAAPFEPPPYRGLSLLLAPAHPLDNRPIFPRPTAMTPKSDQPQLQPLSHIDTQSHREPRERSETMSTSSESYVSSNSTDMTSPSISDFQPKTPDSPVRSAHTLEPDVVISEEDVQMHPCESMRVSPAAKAQGLDQEHHPLPCEPNVEARDGEDTGMQTGSSGSSAGEDDNGPSCIFANALHAQDIFHFPAFTESDESVDLAEFRQPKLPHHINLRNLNIQQIKYTTISDVILYTKGGVGAGVLQVAQMIAESQEKLYQQRVSEYYAHQSPTGSGEGISEPVRYGVWVLVEPFSHIEKFAPHLVNLDSRGNSTDHTILTDLFERETIESRSMTRASEVVEGFWVGNFHDVAEGNPADNLDSIANQFDICLRASEQFDMPSSNVLTMAYHRLGEMDKKRRADGNENRTSWKASPATIALRNLLSPSGSASPVPESGSGSKRSVSPSDDISTPTKTSRKSRSESYSIEPVKFDCAGSTRTVTGHLRNMQTMTDKVVELVYFLRKLIEGRDKSGLKRKVLVYCQDGYTESSIIVLAYIMSSLSISLPEAYLHLQLNAKRSFFLYPNDKPLLRRVDNRLTADRKSQALKLVSSPSSGSMTNSDPPSPTTPTSSPLSSRWKAWGFGIKDSTSTSTTTNTTVSGVSSSSIKSGSLNSSSTSTDHQLTVDVARQMLLVEEKGGSKESQDAKVWFDDKRFDGFPSRIMDFLYLGNLEHAGNAAMLHALGITHVVSVGESLITCPVDHDPMYGKIGTNTLSAEYSAGRIQVLDLMDIRDDGNDPLRPLIARACAWIEEARQGGGTVLVHCRVGVSRSASIVMAYMMQHRRLGLMDAYLMTRARRLNVLIQPNLRFFHELFGWEVELAKAEEKIIQMKRDELRQSGKSKNEEEEVLRKLEEARRKIYYSWPAFCRDLHCLNRRFLCN